MRRSANRRAATTSTGRNRRLLAVGAVITAFGGVISFTQFANADTTPGAPPGSGAGKVVNGQAILTDTCVDSKLPAFDGFQNGGRCVSTEFGEVGTEGDNPSLLITDAPRSVAVNTPFTLKISTRNLIRDRFLAAGKGGYYVESSVLKDGLVRGHFHTACRMLANTDEAPAPEPVPAFFVATEDSKGSGRPDTVDIQVPGLPTAGQAQCASWAGDGSHRIPMMQRANQTPALDAVRITVKDGGQQGDGNNGGNNNGDGQQGDNGNGNGNNGGGQQGGNGNNGGGQQGGNGNNGGGQQGGNGNNGGGQQGGNGNNGGGQQGGNGNNGGNDNGGQQGGNNGNNGGATATTKAAVVPAQTTAQPTVKDAFTPDSTTKAPKPKKTRNTEATTVTEAPVNEEPATEENGTTEQNSTDENSTDDNGTDEAVVPAATTEAPRPKSSSKTPASGTDYTYSTEDGVPNSGTKAPAIQQAEPAAAGNNTGPLALTGYNSVAIVGTGGIIVLIGLIVMTFSRRRRRPGSTWQ